MTYCSSLLDVLADRKGKNGVSGTVLINGRRRPKNFKCVAGYVVQVCVCVCVVQDIYIYIYYSTGVYVWVYYNYDGIAR